MFCVSSSSVGMTFILGYVATLDDVTLTSVGHRPKSWGLLGPTDYFTNLGGGRDGIFLITRHSNVMFSLEVNSPVNCSREKHQVCSFLFSYNKWALLTNITMAKKNYCTNPQEEKRENFLWKKREKTL